MQFGLHLGTRGAAGNADGLIAIASKAEALGFSHLGLSDHIAISSNVESSYPYTQSGQWFAQDTGYCLEQLATLCFLAGITQRVRLLTSVMVVPYREPILAAKMLASVDVLSRGRLIVGVGAGWMAEEMQLLGAPPFAARARVTDEYIQAFKVLWTEPLPSYHGDHVHFQDLLAEPKPQQRPHPPFWSGGETAPARKRAARLANAWYPVINNPKNPLTTCERYKRSIDDVNEQAEQLGRDPATIEQALLAIGFALHATPLPDAGRVRFQGSASQVLCDLDAYARAGLNHFIIAFESSDVNATLDALEQFEQDVMRPYLGQ